MTVIGDLTYHCATPQEYQETLARINASLKFSSVQGDEQALTISVHVDTSGEV